MKKIALMPVLLFASLAQAGVCRDNSTVVGFVGDILVHNDLYESILSKKTFKPLWQESIPLFQKTDFMVGNLEGPAALGIHKDGSDKGDVGFTYDLKVYSGTNFSFNFHPQILSDLKSSGFDLLTVANNHSLDRRWRGIDRTHEAARQVGLPIVGTRPSYAPNEEMYQIADIQGLRLAFIGCTEMSNVSSDSKNQVLFCYDKAGTVANMVSRLKARSDVDGVIVYSHWGSEYQQSPNSSQKRYAKTWLEAGATAVIGSHPHVLQPWESYRTQDGRKTLIAYSLGNFLAFQAGTAKKTGVIVYLKLARTSLGAEVIDAYYTPTYRDGYRVSPAKGGSSAGAEAAKFYGTEKRVEPSQKIPGC